MNEYEEAMNYLWKSYDENKIYGIASRGYLETLQELVDKAESFEWIPFPPKDEVLDCPDCLIPEVDEEILVSDGKDVWQDRWLISSKGNECDYELNSEKDFEGLAWMHLPEPYKEK